MLGNIGGKNLSQALSETGNVGVGGGEGEPGFYCTHGRVNFDHTYTITIIFITRLS